VTFSYQLERADALAFQRFRTIGSCLRGGAHAWMLRGFALLALVLALVEWRIGDPPTVVGLLLFAVAILLFPRAYWALVLGRCRKAVDDPQNAHWMGRKTMTMTRGGLRIAEPGEESKLAWVNVIRGARTDDHIFLFVSTLEAVVIPRASLEGASFEEVWTQAVAYLDDHHERGGRQELEGARPETIQGTPAVTFSYQLEEADWKAFSAHHRQHSQGHGQHRWLARFAVLSVPLFPMILGLIRPPMDGDLVAICAAVGVIGFLFYPRILDGAAMRQAGRVATDPANVHCLGRKTVTLSPEGLQVRGVGVEASIAWTHIVKTERTDDHIFIYLSSVGAMVIPRASLEGVSFDDVWARVNEYLSPKDEGNVPR